MNTAAQPAQTGPHAIEVETVAKRFGRVVALDGVDLAVPQGSVFALLGPNGAGKSTLIDILCTISRPDSGQARVGGYDVVKNPRAVRNEIGVVFQTATLDTRLTVRENLAFHAAVYHMTASAGRRRTTEMLELADLTDRADAVVGTLSSGMRRRLEIARAMMHEPSILFLDEPTVGLDAPSRARLWSFIDTMRRTTGLTVVVTTHYIEEVEGCDLVSIIDHGTILATGSPAELKSDHGKTLVRLTPRDEETRTAIMEAYPSAKPGVDGQILLTLEHNENPEAVLSRFGSELRQISVDQPSLESVFLSLTGREIGGAPAQGRKGRANG